MGADPIQNIVILGGGSAGWLTAGLIAAEHNTSSNQGIKVTLIESANVPTIGVGEGTWPSMRNTLQRIGISETELFRECDAAFKQGAKFAKWVTGAEDDFYYHPLVLPHGFNDSDLVSPWLQQNHGMSFADAVCCQSHICERGLAPKQITTPEYASVANYAYHLDAVKLGILLHKHCTQKLQVNHIVDHVIDVTSTEQGDIKGLMTQQHGEIEGDLFVDCSGLTSLLLGQHFNIPFISKKETFFNDTAIAMHVPYPNEEAPIASHTISTAHSAGWIWDIGLPTRKGVGIVFASDYMDDDSAENALREYVRASVDAETEKNLSCRKISFDPGHRKTFWHRNCVGIGLSAGFLEPLEASALVLVEQSASMLVNDLPANRQVMDVIAKRFNTRLQYYWDTIVDFLKLHYVLTKRTDSQYWLDHCDRKTWSDTLNESLALWKTQIPNKYDFPLREEMFPEASWQYVLYGMGFKTNPPASGLKADKIEKANQYMRESAQLTQRYIKALPTNRDLIKKIMQYGMQKV
ncbi:tryptophan halogenase family protein [Aliiglaciecola lipolytica]|uniref:Tryptophan halogenase n=1 Tax=Aliiglaciecola lipolytica E3 TaxID=1127673 RepID=K6XUI9_9ALTE|nr:tryptophan halogenase family protein [Aliiglaciecola lipolytica]GAC15306.1 tryptophan halogenase [Aliiglaciecola lipolytica E3]